MQFISEKKYSTQFRTDGRNFMNQTQKYCMTNLSIINNGTF